MRGRVARVVGSTVVALAVGTASGTWAGTALRPPLTDHAITGSLLVRGITTRFACGPAGCRACPSADEMERAEVCETRWVLVMGSVAGSLASTVVLLVAFAIHRQRELREAPGRGLGPEG